MSVYDEWKKNLQDAMCLCMGKTEKETEELIYDFLSPSLENGNVSGYSLHHEDEGKKCILEVQVPIIITVAMTHTGEDIRSIK
jgi:hypothetical protein